jgi:large subunit ribosomal protein L5
MARLKDRYSSEIVPALMEEFGYANVMQVPRLEKVTVNVCVKEAIQNIKALEAAAQELGQITGQYAMQRKARKSVANFKLRKGMPLGASVTLRRDRMYEFVDRLISLAIPRIRDFRGLSPKSFDGRGNYSMGVTEQIIFPEVDYDKVYKLHGLSITFVTSAETDAEARSLLRHLGMPFKS